MIAKLLYVFVGLILASDSIAADCVPTPQRPTGGHYKPVTVEKTDVSTGVLVRGRVFAAPDCTPVANAKVAHWQAGEDGRYADRLRAYQFTDANGLYQFETEWPNLFRPHIHFIVSADGYKTLETQWIGEERQHQIEFDLVIVRE